MIGFVEKPKSGAKTMPGDPTRCLASMGNYLFTTDALVQEIVRDAGDPNERPRLRQVDRRLDAPAQARLRLRLREEHGARARARRSAATGATSGASTPTTRPTWTSSTVDPVFSLYNDHWPIYTIQHNYPPAKFVFNNERENRVGRATDSLVSEGCIISGGHVHHSILSPKVRVNSYADVEDSILFENVNIGRHCRIRRAIIDKHVEIPPHTTIGYDLEKDRKHFHVTESGIVVIPKGMRIEASRRSALSREPVRRRAAREPLRLVEGDLEIDRLLHHVEGAELERAGRAGSGRPPNAETTSTGIARGPRVRLELLQHVAPVELRHRDVEQDEVGQLRQRR